MKLLKELGFKSGFVPYFHFPVPRFSDTPYRGTLLRVCPWEDQAEPGRTRQGVIMLKSPISLKLITNVRYQELTYVTECQVKILNSLGDPGSPFKNRHFARFMHN